MKVRLLRSFDRFTADFTSSVDQKLQKTEAVVSSLNQKVALLRDAQRESIEASADNLRQELRKEAEVQSLKTRLQAAEAANADLQEALAAAKTTSAVPSESSGVAANIGSESVVDALLTKLHSLQQMHNEFKVCFCFISH